MNVLNQWHDAFLATVQEPQTAESLKAASLALDLTGWTAQSTTAVVRACTACGWEASARGHVLDRLPESASEYLNLDAMAFPSRDEFGGRWPAPVAVFELENSPRDERVAYSLWKVLCVRAPLRVVFAYRAGWEPAIRLVQHLAAEVVAPMAPLDRMNIDGETAVVIGSRGEGETFPYGYFKCWALDMNLATFERV